MNGCEDDPRLSGEHVRTVSGSNGTVTLAGVVHDHPASKYRVQAIVADQNPDILALELPPVALPLFEQYARDDRTPPVFGGEMSAAIQAVSDGRVVGIDGPTVGFVGRLGRTLYRNGSSLETTRRVAEGLLSATKQALTCRAASHLAAVTDVRLEVDSPLTYETSWDDDPERQAIDERMHLDRARSVLDVFEPPRAMHIRDTTREAHMADELDALREEGDVVAVVGRDHLDQITTLLSDQRPS